MLGEVFLEHDFGSAGELEATPALFAGFGAGALTVRDDIASFLEGLWPEAIPAWRRLVAILAIAADHGLESGRIMGLMLSRTGELRCMIRVGQPAAVAALMASAGWTGEIAPLEALLADPVIAGGEALLVLGDDGALTAGCGIEIIFGDDPAGLGPRANLLNWLVERGLADPMRAAALDHWNGTLTPLDAPGVWPDALIARALTELGRFALLRRFVNHVKLNIADGEIVAAKAYLALVPVDGRLAGASVGSPAILRSIQS